MGRALRVRPTPARVPRSPGTSLERAAHDQADEQTSEVFKTSEVSIQGLTRPRLATLPPLVHHFFTGLRHTQIANGMLRAISGAKGAGSTSDSVSSASVARSNSAMASAISARKLSDRRVLTVCLVRGDSTKQSNTPSGTRKWMLSAPISSSTPRWFSKISTGVRSPEVATTVA